MEFRNLDHRIFSSAETKYMLMRSDPPIENILKHRFPENNITVRKTHESVNCDYLIHPHESGRRSGKYVTKWIHTR